MWYGEEQEGHVVERGLDDRGKQVGDRSARGDDNGSAPAVLGKERACRIREGDTCRIREGDICRMRGGAPAI